MFATRLLRRAAIPIPLHAAATRTIKSILANSSTLENEQLTINAWVRTCRRSKTIAFASINDGSNLTGLQAVLPNGIDLGITVGCSASFKGRLVASPGRNNEVEFLTESVEILGQSDAETYPIPNTKQAIPSTILRHNAHFRARADQTAAMLRIRSEMAWAAHSYFREERYVQVQTPLITSSDCEGAGEVFRVEAGAAAAPIDPSLPIPPPPIPKYLTVSSQLHLEAIASSLPHVYTLSPSFRAEKSDTARHLQEFWMLEAEVSFLPADEAEGLQRVMSIAEGVLRRVISNALEQNEEDLGYFDKRTPGLIAQLRSVVDSAPFPRLSYAEAIVALQSALSTTSFVYKPTYGASLQTEHEKWLAEEYVKGPVFITDYPSAQKPFYMLPNSTPSDSSNSTSACFDLLIPRLGELAGGSLREHREKELLDSMRARGISEGDYEWYIELRRYGSTRHGGFGMGWERLVAFVTGLENVRDCIAFPRAAEGSRF